MINLNDLKEQVEETAYNPRLLVMVVIAVAEQLERLANSQAK